MAGHRGPFRVGMAVHIPKLSHDCRLPLTWIKSRGVLGRGRRRLWSLSLPGQLENDGGTTSSNPRSSSGESVSPVDSGLCAQSPAPRVTGRAKAKPIVKSPQPRGGLHQGVEHRLQIEGRAADDRQHVAGRGMVFERFLELPGALTQQPGHRGIAFQRRPPAPPRGRRCGIASRRWRDAAPASARAEPMFARAPRLPHPAASSRRFSARTIG
jgi:hypothetical protein